MDSSGQRLQSSFRPHLSARGRFVVFTSGHSPIGSGDQSGYFDVFVRDREAGTTQRILGQAAVPGGGFTDVPRLSPTGRFVVFPSGGASYVGGDTNGSEDVFVHERSGPVEQPLAGSDGNGDGIADSLQPAGTPAGSFSNAVQGKANPTTGTVVSGSVKIEDVADPAKGVRITATTDAVLTVCGGFELRPRRRRRGHDHVQQRVRRERHRRADHSQGRWRAWWSSRPGPRGRSTPSAA